MRRFPRPRLTFANVVACLALFVALGGTGYAALRLPPSSVGTRQLKAGAVTSAKVKRGAIGLSDIRASARRRLAGFTHVVMRKSDDETVQKNNFKHVDVSCEPGERATGGGVYNESSVFFVRVTSSYPLPNPFTPPAKGDDSPATGWRVWVANDNLTTSADFNAYVLCAS